MVVLLTIKKNEWHKHFKQFVAAVTAAVKKHQQEAVLEGRGKLSWNSVTTRRGSSA